MKQTLQRKNFRLDTAKLRRAQKELGTKTETETIHVALDMATSEARLARTLKTLLDKGGKHFHFDGAK
jgi:Arc/MetJ family transcription regulator